MAKLKIKKGDLVQVISGRSQKNGGDRGKQGKVIAVYPDTERVLVEGINRVTKHVKAGPRTVAPGPAVWCTRRPRST
jgi:large subunit ribosomal protein L24